MTTMPLPKPGLSSRPARVALSLLVATEAAVGAAAFGLMASDLPWRMVLTSYGATNAWLAATFAPIGALVAARRPKSAIGWLFCGFALAYGLSAASISLALWQATTANPQPWMSTVGWFGLWAWTPAIALCFPLILALFPDGHLPSPRWRWLIGAAVVNVAVWPFSVALDSGEMQGIPFITRLPITTSGVLGEIVKVADDIDNVAVGLVALASLGLLGWRWQRAEGRQRAQLSWLLAGAVTATALFTPEEFNIQSLWAVLLLVGVPLLPAAAAVAILRHRLLDLDIVINRTIVYGLLSGVLVLAYLGVVEAGRALLGGQTGLGTSLPAAAVVALLFAPARQFLQGKVDTLLYGSRRDAARTLSTVTTTLQQSPGDELVAALGSLAEAMRLPAVGLEVDGRRIGRWPDDSGQPDVIPLSFRAEAAGELLVWPRRGQAHLGGDDVATLRLVAVPLAAAVHALRVNEQLQDSRRQLITAREEEQRRLHHDLHDGLGPTLTAIALKADAARRDESRANNLLSQISAEARDAIGEVRRIAHDLRSPRLESLGLLGAMRYQATQLSSGPDGRSVIVTVEGPEQLPPIPCDVEEAAYQVTGEAITNAVRHAGASRITVQLAAGAGTLSLQIADDGPNTTGEWSEGFGLSGMRQRAERCGGHVRAGPTPDGGLVALRFPLLDSAGMGT